MRAMLTGPGQARFEAQGLCLIKPGRNKEARHSDDTRKGNTNAQTLPEHYRWHVCCLARVSLVPATRTVGVRKPETWSKHVRKDGRSCPSIAKQTEPVT